MKRQLAIVAGRATVWTWSNPLYGLFHGPRFLRAFAAWVLPRWGYFYKWAGEDDDGGGA